MELYTELVQEWSSPNLCNPYRLNDLYDEWKEFMYPLMDRDTQQLFDQLFQQCISSRSIQSSYPLLHYVEKVIYRLYAISIERRMILDTTRQLVLSEQKLNQAVLIENQIASELIQLYCLTKLIGMSYFNHLLDINIVDSYRKISYYESVLWSTYMYPNREPDWVEQYAKI